MSETMTSRAYPQAFPATRWSLVLAACRQPSAESAAALETVCHAYWYPLYAYARRSGQSPHDAQDITQEFFRLLLEKHWLEQADRAKGKLRAFLITALKHFMAKEWRRLSAQKRGGGQLHLPIDTAFAESRYATAPGTPSDAAKVFDREWALTLLELTMDRLRKEFTVAGKASEFAILKDFLAVTHHAIDYSAAATRLGISAGNARVVVHRLRKRFRELYREEISQTLPAGADVETELRHLANALASS
jgi:DNA-directed RNA polymerase specialized sigma24 family protein